jgi:hypothetical protein
MSVMDLVTAILLAVGLALSLPIWWWMFLEPLVRLCKLVVRRAGPFLLYRKVRRSRQ